MKKTIPALLLLCLLFCGCGKVPEETSPSAAPVTQPDITAPAGFYNPGDPLENATGGAVRAYPLPTITSSQLILLFNSFEDDDTCIR